MPFAVCQPPEHQDAGGRGEQTAVREVRRTGEQVGPHQEGGRTEVKDRPHRQQGGIGLDHRPLGPLQQPAGQTPAPHQQQGEPQGRRGAPGRGDTSAGMVWNR